MGHSEHKDDTNVTQSDGSVPCHRAPVQTWVPGTNSSGTKAPAYLWGMQQTGLSPRGVTFFSECFPCKKQAPVPYIR